MEKNCHTCRLGYDNTGTACLKALKDCFYPVSSAWEPVPKDKPGQTTLPAEYKITQAMFDEHMSRGVMLPSLPAEKLKVEETTPKPKENEMWKKVKHLARMLGTLWLAYGLIWKLIIPLVTFTNPYVVWAFSKTPICHDPDSLDGADTGMAWFVTFWACALFVLGVFLLHKFTKFFFGELEK